MFESILLWLVDVCSGGVVELEENLVRFMLAYVKCKCLIGQHFGLCS